VGIGSRFKQPTAAAAAAAAAIWLTYDKQQKEVEEEKTIIIQSRQNNNAVYYRIACRNSVSVSLLVSPAAPLTEMWRHLATDDVRRGETDFWTLSCGVATITKRRRWLVCGLAKTMTNK
jgi:hypothetical protein